MKEDLDILKNLVAFLIDFISRNETKSPAKSKKSRPKLVLVKGEEKETTPAPTEESRPAD